MSPEMPVEPLDERTAELTRRLGDPIEAIRSDGAVATLTTWLAQGVYDDLLAGLGDGMAAGLGVGLGERGTDSAFRRSASATVLGECVVRDTVQTLVPGAKVLEWGDRLVAWLVRERDPRALGAGAEALAALADSPHAGLPELTVLLDVVGDRVTSTDPALPAGVLDALASTTMRVLRRGVVPANVVLPWVVRLSGAAASPEAPAQAFLRTLYLQLALTPAPPAHRADLLLAVVDSLRATNPSLRG